MTTKVASGPPAASVGSAHLPGKTQSPNPFPKKAPYYDKKNLTCGPGGQYRRTLLW